jgi:hypothetical protein
MEHEVNESNLKPLANVQAVIHKIQTLKGGDGAFRITLDVPEIHRDEIKHLFDVTEYETVFVAFVKREHEERQEAEFTEKPKRAPRGGIHT